MAQKRVYEGEEDHVADLSLTGLPIMHEQMVQLERTMADEYDKIKERWIEYAKDKEELDRIRNRIASVSVNELDRMKLNVGGSRFEIRATCAKGNTYFRSLMSGTFQSADADGFYYIDKDPAYVQVILNYLREGTVDLSEFTDKQLARIAGDAEFYMVQDLQSEIDNFRKVRRSGERITLCQVNMTRGVTDCFNGLFFELNVMKKEFKLHSISFVAGERRKIVGEAYVKEGPLDSAGQARKIGVVEEQVEKGQLVAISFSAIPLPMGTHTIGVYSVSCPTAIAVCPRKESKRQFAGFTMERSFHTANQKGFFNQRAGEDEYDFSGELAVSF